MNFVSVGCMVSTLAVDSWSSFESNDEDAMKNYKGKLLETSSLHNERHYENYIHIYYNCLESSCQMWKNLYIGGSSYVIFESLAIFCTIATAVVLVLFLRKKDYIVLGVFFSLLAWMSHLIATFVWIFVVNANFKSNCYDSDALYTPICGESAPKLAVFILIFTSISNVTFVYCARLIIIHKVSLESQKIEISDTESNINQTKENDLSYIKDFNNIIN